MESLVHYINPAHAISLLGVLNEQRLKGQLCDVILMVGDQRYEAHRSVLAASSDYFQSLFTRTDSEAHATVQLDFCEPEAFENVLNYIYSSSLFVDKGSLAAIQELGYSLGIPFLTNIMSARPQVSYSISRKRMSFSEEDDNRYQKRSVIVCQSSGSQATPAPSRGKDLNHNGKMSLKQTASATSELVLTAQCVRGPCRPSEFEKPKDGLRSVASGLRGSAEAMESPDDGSSAPVVLARSRTAELSSTRPQLTSSVSLSESQIQHSSVQAATMGGKEETPAPRHNPRQPMGEGSRVVDRSGPLIKSLLRRSLSMDSPVPVFSPVLELREEQNRAQSVVKMAAKSSADSEHTEQRRPNSSASPPPSGRAAQFHKYIEENDRSNEVHVKTEPSSPLADPSDIIRITVGDNLPVNFRDFQVNFDEGPRGFYKHSGKRKVRLDGRKNQFKKSKFVAEPDFATEDNSVSPSDHNTVLNDSRELGEARQNKMFKCWNCLKVFRSNAGLYRHVNMYHNPEKPYSCGICHKRFHTNFKVWTHCQTQHGIIQNPAASSSSYTVLDEKFQRKLIDIVREREIKKALIMKLRRNKQGSLQSQPFSKRNVRSKSKTYMCPYCGKLFWFQSQFKQHLKTHPCEKSDSQVEREDSIQQNQERAAYPKENKSKEVYPCRLCNEKLPSLFEQGDHERGCRHATVCPYCGLRFSSPVVKKDHESHCEYKKLTCLECMRTFKSSFSIWRHQVEVHNQNIMTAKEQLSLSLQDGGRNVSDLLRPLEPAITGASKEDVVFSDSSGPVMFDSEESSFMPEDLSTGQEQGELRVKEEPEEEAVDERSRSGGAVTDEPGVWPCEKCGKLFSTHKQLERHQELLCHIKPFICHICNKAFRTNFRLWSHFQSHMTGPEEAGARECTDRRPSSSSPSPPPAPSAARPPTPQAPSPKPAPPVTVAHPAQQAAEENKQDGGAASKMDTPDKPLAPQESETLFYHAPTLSALTFKRQYMCKLCHRTFKTAFSLWSHEQSHANP